METVREKALAIAARMEDGRGEDVALIDVSALSSWTEYFVIVTVTSSAHWKGLYKDLKEFSQIAGLEIHTPSRKSPQGDDWNLIDLGPIVVHLMSREARSFYELEKLWFNGERIK